MDAEVEPADWNIQGRQANVWKELGTPYFRVLVHCVWC
jgi:hypothetical protein